jgi:hypothetical protein
LKRGSSIIAITLQTGGSEVYYRALFKRDLAIICTKLEGFDLSNDEKMAVLKMFASLPNDPKKSGIFACAPGIGRLLEQICGCLDVPKKPEKILPWLVMQFQEEILHQMVMQLEATGKYLHLIDAAHLNNNDSTHDVMIDAAHFGNVLMMILGEKIGLSDERIDKASQDVMAQMSSLPENEQEELLDLFNELYTEEALETYLMGRINSQLDGRPGLKEFRNYMIQQLAETVSETEIEASKQEIQDKFEVGQALSDDPNFYVKLHYFRYPDADPSDESSSDLNEKGIRAFAASLKNNPFAYFATTAV